MIWDKFGYNEGPFVHAKVFADSGPVIGLTSAVRQSGAVSSASMSSRQELHEKLVEEAEALRWVQKYEELREQNIDDIKSLEGANAFQFGESLRLTWLSQQKADRELAGLLDGKSPPDGYRVAQDGVLEREVKMPPPCGAKSVSYTHLRAHET